MTVAELIAELQKLDPERLVTVRNKDGYLDTPTVITPTCVKRMKHYPDFKLVGSISRGDQKYYGEEQLAVQVK